MGTSQHVLYISFSRSRAMMPKLPCKVLSGKRWFLAIIVLSILLIFLGSITDLKFSTKTIGYLNNDHQEIARAVTSSLLGSTSSDKVNSSNHLNVLSATRAYTADMSKNAIHTTTNETNVTQTQPTKLALNNTKDVQYSNKTSNNKSLYKPNNARNDTSVFPRPVTQHTDQVNKTDNHLKISQIMNDTKSQNRGNNAAQIITDRDNISKSLGMNFFGTFKLNISLDKNKMEPFCAVEADRHKYLLWPDKLSNMTEWGFRERRECPKFIINNNLFNSSRIKYSLSCATGKPMLIPSLTNSTSDVDVVALNDTCLASFTKSCCTLNNGVPNVVHYVWYFKKAMRFDLFLSILSVIRFVRPCLIIFHGEYLPYGNFWDYVIHLYPYILQVKTPRPLFISGKKINHHEHSGDVMRINALVELGGIYLDIDVIVLQNLKRLQDYDVTMCRQSGGQFMLNCFILAKKNATFLSYWKEGYRTNYKNDSYVFNSMYYNNDLARAHPNLIHVENGTMCCPDVLIGVNLQSPMIYDWSKLYGFHIYTRQIHFKWDVDLIRNFNTTLGSMLRHIVYGNKELCY